MRIFALLILGGIAGACADGERPARTERDDVARADRVTSPVERIYDYGLSFGESLAAIERTLGPPPAADTSLEPNRHVRDATDSLFVLHYDGLTFELNRPGPVDGELLASVAMTAADRELPGGVRIGTTARDDLVGDLGVPENTRSRGDTVVLSYTPPGVAADRFVEFHLVGDTLRRVRWAPYVD